MSGKQTHLEAGPVLVEVSVLTNAEREALEMRHIYRPFVSRLASTGSHLPCNYSVEFFANCSLRNAFMSAHELMSAALS